MKRWLLKFATFLLLGAIINIAVAWGGAIFNARLPLLSDSLPSQPYELWREYAPTSWPALGPREAEFIPGRQMRFIGYSQIHVIQSENFGTNNGKQWILCHVSSGFPTYCLTATSMTEVPPLSSSFEDGFVLTWGLRPIPGGGRAPIVILLPYGILWFRFLVNTVFFGTVVWFLSELPHLFAGTLRLRRGLCPNCAYPTAALERCSECGTIAQPVRVVGWMTPWWHRVRSSMYLAAAVLAAAAFPFVFTWMSLTFCVVYVHGDSSYLLILFQLAFLFFLGSVCRKGFRNRNRSMRVNI